MNVDGKDFTAINCNTVYVRPNETLGGDFYLVRTKAMVVSRTSFRRLRSKIDLK